MPRLATSGRALAVVYEHIYDNSRGLKQLRLQGQCTLKFSGKEEGRQHQMPSVSSSNGTPICSTRRAARYRVHGRRCECSRGLACCTAAAGWEQLQTAKWLPRCYEASHVDDASAAVGHDPRHLHGVPPRALQHAGMSRHHRIIEQQLSSGIDAGLGVCLTRQSRKGSFLRAHLAHDVAVEGVEDALVGELQAVVQHHHVRRLLRRQRVSGRLRTVSVRSALRPMSAVGAPHRSRHDNQALQDKVCGRHADRHQDTEASLTVQVWCTKIA
jgi:hypothetical protein